MGFGVRVAEESRFVKVVKAFSLCEKQVMGNRLWVIGKIERKAGSAEEKP
ncbi:MAG: hypothetical protein OHK0040_10190 [bacterium]